MIRINVNGVSATVTAKEILTAGRVGLECEFTFDDEWDGLFKTAVFQGIETIEVALPNAVCTVPYEALAVEGVQLKIGVYGANGAGTVVIPTVWVNAGKILPSAGAVPPDTPTQTVNAYAVEKAEQAYNIALGVQQKAENGDFDGAPGTPGADGFSPTATVSKGGNTATITITDENGTTTAVIYDGADGSKIWNTTVEPLESLTGTFTFQVSDLSGASGTPAVGDLIFYDSAYYPIAGVIGNINVGLEAIANYKASIRGADGADGATGADGPQGPAGPGVPAGGTTGQVLKKKSGTDYDTEWADESGGSSIDPYTSTPAALGTASAGSSDMYSRGDHVHQKPTAADIGAIPAPSSPATGAFLVWDGSAWTAQTLSTWQGGSF